MEDNIDSKEIVDHLQANYEKDKERWINQYSLFAPKSKSGLHFDYPELKDVPEFKSLSVEDTLFAWYFGCEASPVANVKDQQLKVDKIIEFMHRINDGYFDNSKKKSQYRNLNFPEKVEIAIQKMAAYRMGPRVRGKKMIDQVLSNYENIISMDINSADFRTEDNEKDFDKIKKYVDSSSTIMKNLNSLIQQSEGGFAVTERSGKAIDEEESFMDDYHDHIDQ